MTPDQLKLASEVVGAAPSLREALTVWRAREPSVRAIVVDALDMRGESPALEVGGRRVYLAASDGHCWRVTAQPDEASALILAES